MDNPKRSLLGVYSQLAKTRLSALVLLTTAVGFVMGSPEGAGGVGGAGIDWVRLLLTTVGTALAAGAANALNQICEMRRDALMIRTRNRPLPSGAISPRHALLFGMVTAYAGLSILGLLVNMASAGLALLTIVIYLGVYTPLKTRSTLNTVVGAVCGAIPPMIGWVAASGRLDAGAWVLGALLFVWQIPHFFAIAWLYREDYERGGFVMLPVVDRTGRITGQVVVLTSLGLLPLALAATLFGLTGRAYAFASIVLGAWILGFGARLYAQRNDVSARRLFLASLVYLPLLLCMMMVDRGPVGGDGFTVASQASASVPDDER
jgi:protoheme IX farnesyltransferase